MKAATAAANYPRPLLEAILALPPDLRKALLETALPPDAIAKLSKLPPYRVRRTGDQLVADVLGVKLAWRTFEGWHDLPVTWAGGRAVVPTVAMIAAVWKRMQNPRRWGGGTRRRNSA